MRIEAIEDLEDANAESEYISITGKPVAKPRHPDEVTAHFYTRHSTSTFIVERYLNHVGAAVQGRKGKPKYACNISVA